MQRQEMRQRHGSATVKARPGGGEQSLQCEKEGVATKWEVSFVTLVIGYCDYLGTINRREWKRLKGCVFSPPSVRPVPARGREQRRRNPSVTSIPTPVYNNMPTQQGNVLANVGGRRRAPLIIVMFDGFANDQNEMFTEG